MDALESLVSLHAELDRRARAVIATPMEARRINTELRVEMQQQNNYLPHIEEIAEEWVRGAGYSGGALTHRQVAMMAERLGFTIIHVDDLPHSTRTVTDLRNGRIYLPPASIPGGYGLRSLALQAMAHRILATPVRGPTATSCASARRSPTSPRAVCCRASPRSSTSPPRSATRTWRWRTSATPSGSPTTRRPSASPTWRPSTSTSRSTSSGRVMTARCTAATRTTASRCPPTPRVPSRGSRCAASGRPGRPSSGATGPPSSPSTPTPRRGPTGAPRRPAPGGSRSSPSRSACPSPRPSGSAGARPRGEPRRPARTRAAAGAPRPSSPSGGASTPGPAPRCTPTCSAHCPRAASPGWTTPRCSSSSSHTPLSTTENARPGPTQELSCRRRGGRRWARTRAGIELSAPWGEGARPGPTQELSCRRWRRGWPASGGGVGRPREGGGRPREAGLAGFLGAESAIPAGSADDDGAGLHAHCHRGERLLGRAPDHGALGRVELRAVTRAGEHLGLPAHCAALMGAHRGEGHYLVGGHPGDHDLRTFAGADHGRGTDRDLVQRQQRLAGPRQRRRLLPGARSQRERGHAGARPGQHLAPARMLAGSHGGNLPADG